MWVRRSKLYNNLCLFHMTVGSYNLIRWNIRVRAVHALWFGLMIHCDAWNDSAGRNAVCLRFKCTMCKKESCASGMFFFLLLVILEELHSANLMYEIWWFGQENYVEIGLLWVSVWNVWDVIHGLGFFGIYFHATFGKVIRQTQDPGTWLQNVSTKTYTVRQFQ